MPRSPYNAVRRNRNIGTVKQGHGQNNRLVIPQPTRNWTMFWEDLRNAVAVTASLGRTSLTFLVEPPHRGFLHPCTLEDVLSFIDLVPSKDLFGLRLVLMRQPTRKQRILSCVWGRLLYHAVCGPYRGAAICLEAQCPSEPRHWPLALAPDDRRELERLRSDGHEVVRTRRGHEIRRSPSAIRSTMLFRTVPH